MPLAYANISFRQAGIVTYFVIPKFERKKKIIIFQSHDC